MAIEFECLECQTLLRVPDNAAGKHTKCPQCGRIMIAPSPATNEDQQNEEQPGVQPAAPIQPPAPLRPAASSPAWSSDPQLPEVASDGAAPASGEEEEDTAGTEAAGKEEPDKEDPAEKEDPADKEDPAEKEDPADEEFESDLFIDSEPETPADATPDSTAPLDPVSVPTSGPPTPPAAPAVPPLHQQLATPVANPAPVHQQPGAQGDQLLNPFAENDSPWRADATPVVTVPMAKSRVMGPAIGLMVTSVLSVLWGIGVLISEVFEPSGDPDATVGLIVFCTAMLIWGVVVLVGSIQLFRLRSRAVAWVGETCSVVPCTCCYPLMLPFGVWAIVALSNSDVAAAFDR